VLELELVTIAVLEDTGAVVVDVELDGVLNEAELVTTLDVVGVDVVVGVEDVVRVDDDVVEVLDIGATTSRDRSQYTSCVIAWVS